MSFHKFVIHGLPVACYCVEMARKVVPKGMLQDGVIQTDVVVCILN
jgi:hypothetical protein